MSIEAIEAQVIDLDVLTYNAAAVLDELGLARGSLEFAKRELPERLALQILAMLKVPGKVLQDRKVAAEYPASFWDYVKRLLRMRHRLVQVRVTEHLVYPTVAVPRPYANSVRLYVMPEISSVWA